MLSEIQRLIVVNRAICTTYTLADMLVGVENTSMELPDMTQYLTVSNMSEPYMVDFNGWKVHHNSRQQPLCKTAVAMC